MNEFVDAVVSRGRLYNVGAAAGFERKSADYFDNQLEIIQANYGKWRSLKSFVDESYICSAFVVACYSVVGIIAESAHVAYPPEFFSPAGLYGDPTFGWLLGYLLPEGGSVPAGDPLLAQTTHWRDNLAVRWW
ncbi:hypothetical protein K9U39_18030 [Rhodoblastus acidophilus]|uniref:Uncharacterized protein n=1 Tax=Candidatus Rhodoblastus alkanivorans TaxID=2954117 RepID=A0ABS9Z2C4_9HYPH|nr:hypothetical protein [Candidatus Rhodoblastus alkanivorans]MCI4680592.1 hypothetical protein [Candidatus Rhodoblastus alkanivorans]MCI4681762.1 hypothetical protein [Candidatus Rhodoblastus alkanivorans]MDI4642811.1 hypothetical protein [Rhodoblastus acidophilus]